MSHSELVSELYLVQLDNWMTISMSALALFEFVTTLDQEVSSVWKRKWSGASLLLLAVRYTLFAAAIQTFTLSARLEYKGCMILFIAGSILTSLSNFLTPLFSALRVYALCDGSIKLSAVTFLPQLSPVIVNAYSYGREAYFKDPLFGCSASYNFGVKTGEILTLASRIPVILGDTFVIIITWIKSYEQFKAERGLGIHLSLSTLLFRDGTVYFIILLVLNILELCPLTSPQGGLVVGDIGRTLPLILVHRFMLNLHQLSDDETRSAPRTHTNSTLIFQMSIDIAGNMGENLEHGWEPEMRGNDEVEAQEGLQDAELDISEVQRGNEETGLSGYCFD